MQQALFDARLKLYKEQLSILDSAIFEIEMERHLAQTQQSEQAYLASLFQDIAPTDQEVSEFYEANRAQIPYPLGSVKDQLKQMLIQQKQRARQMEHIAKIKMAQGFESLVAMPLAPYAEIDTAGFPSKGPKDAKITIVEFADYQCPHCKNAATALSRIVEQYGNDIQVVYKDFPINRSGISRQVALGAACADEQGKFWPYHDLAYDQQEQLGNQSHKELAQQLGLDLDAFNQCLASETPGIRIARAEEEALQLGVSSTPTIFLNGRRLHLHDLDSDLVKEIEEILQSQEG